MCNALTRLAMGPQMLRKTIHIAIAIKIKNMLVPLELSVLGRSNSLRFLILVATEVSFRRSDAAFI